MRDALPRIRKLGALLVIIGNGRPEQAADFRDTASVECPLVVDPDLRAYAAAGLRRSVASSLNPRALVHGLRALRAGQMQGTTQGDPWQQGGVFVIRPDDTVAYSYISQEAGDHPDPTEVIAALASTREPSGRNRRAPVQRKRK